jgi:hypothetical protein
MSTAARAVDAAGWPVRLAEDTASGPLSMSSAWASSSSGTRRATVPWVSPRSQPSEGWEWKIRVRPPGQKARASARASSETSSARPSSTPAWAMSTGGGMARDRPLAASRVATPRAENALAPIP